MKDGALTQLPDTEGRILSSIRRGYTAIAEEIKSRGLEPALSMTGKGTHEKAQKRDARVTEANAEAPAPKRRMVRDGMSLG